MSKLNEKMKEVKEAVVDVESEKIEDVKNEEFMTVRVPKAKAYEMLANGEATEAETEKPEKEEVKEKTKILSRLKNSKVAKGVGIAVAVIGGVTVGLVMGKNGNDSDEVTFEDIPQELPYNIDNYQTYDQVNTETKEEV